LGYSPQLNLYSVESTPFVGTRVLMDNGQKQDLKESFFSLSPHSVLDAVELIGVRCTGRLMALNSMENRVYQVEVEVDSEDDLESEYERSRVVKFYRPGRWSREQILAEHRFLSTLEDRDISVVCPLAFPDGSTMKQTADGIYFSVFPRVGGRCLDELSDDQLRLLGRLTARMHLAGASVDLDERITLNCETYGTHNLNYLLQSELLPADYRETYASVVERILSTSQGWFETAAYQPIHGDFHVGNILWHNQMCQVVDFDDSLNGPCVQDIWLIVPGRDEDAKRRRELLLEGYEQMRDFNRETLRLIEPLRALRMIHFSAWIAKRWDDPSFPRVFPLFGSNEYWREQFMALDECLRLMQGGEESLLY
jgi:Ser/Thr protein kinase RdoA (MazF antagonist)